MDTGLNAHLNSLPTVPDGFFNRPSDTGFTAATAGAAQEVQGLTLEQALQEAANWSPDQSPAHYSENTLQTPGYPEPQNQGPPQQQQQMQQQQPVDSNDLLNRLQFVSGENARLMQRATLADQYEQVFQDRPDLADQFMKQITGATPPGTSQDPSQAAPGAASGGGGVSRQEYNSLREQTTRVALELEAQELERAFPPNAQVPFDRTVVSRYALQNGIPSLKAAWTDMLGRAAAEAIYRGQAVVPQGVQQQQPVYQQQVPVQQQQQQAQPQQQAWHQQQPNRMAPLIAPPPPSEAVVGRPGPRQSQRNPIDSYVAKNQDELTRLIDHDMQQLGLLR